jgi:hypothetical protein
LVADDLRCGQASSGANLDLGPCTKRPCSHIPSDSAGIVADHLGIGSDEGWIVIDEIQQPAEPFWNHTARPWYGIPVNVYQR